MFPAIDAVCRAYGGRFQPVDLRWGVSEEAGRDQQTLEICLSEIARCQRMTPYPNFLALLGDRYGWRPLPQAIPSIDFDAIVAAAGHGRRRACLLEWYVPDTNAIPAAHLLRPRPHDAATEWRAIERTLAAALKRGIGRVPHLRERWSHFFASATEHELEVGALGSHGIAGHALCVRRHVDGLPARAVDYRDCRANGRPDAKAAASRRSLEARLRAALGTRVVDLTTPWHGGAPADTHIGDLPEDETARLALLDDPANPSTLCEAVWKGLLPLVLDRCRSAAQEDALQREISAHEDLQRERARLVVGRDDVLRMIGDRVVAAESGPVVLVGNPGSGKTSVLSRVALDIDRLAPPRTTVVRFLGATASSMSGTMLLDGLCQELARVSGRPNPVRGDVTYDELVGEFSRLLLAWPSTQPLAIVLDGIDQLAQGDRARNLAWLPHGLPPHVRLVLSTVPGDISDLLQHKFGARALIPLDELGSSHGDALLTTWLRESSRRVSGAQQVVIAAATARCSLPLYLRLVFEEVRHWRSGDGIPSRDDGHPDLPENVDGALENLCRRLSRDARHGPVLPARALGYVAAARHGLTDDEMVDVLSRDADVLADLRRRSPKSPVTTRIPGIVWARLYFDLETYLTERVADGTSTLTFFHRVMADFFANRYLQGDDGIRRHDGLARYFDEQPLQIMSGGAASWNVRKLSELPYQLAAAQRWNELAARLTDFSFLAAKIAAQGPGAVIEDLDRALAAADSLGTDAVDDLGLLRATVRLSAHILSADPSQLRMQLHGRIAQPASPRIQGLLDQAARAPGVWLRSLEAGFWRAGGAVTSTIVAHQAAVNGVAITADARTGLSASSDGTVKVWDLAAERERFVLSIGPHDWQALALTRDGTTAITGAMDGTIAVWDAVSGHLKRRWEGETACRALLISEENGWLLTGSERRELVIRDLEHGAIVRTIPLGDSAASWMAVSGDGRTLLCGGTYDSVSVLTLPEGDVVRELSHGYDRWVSGVAITEDGSTALSGDWDGNVRVWDVATGRPRARLLGFRHNEQVTALAVTPDGRRAVAASYRGALNVYDLSSADSGVTPVARFGTGPHRITHLAIAPGGATAISAAKDATLRVWNLNATEGTGFTPDKDPFDDEREEYENDRRTLRVGAEATGPLFLGPPEHRIMFSVNVSGFRGTLDDPPLRSPGRKLTEYAPRDRDDDRPPRLRVSAFDSAEPKWLDQTSLESAAVSRNGRMLACFGRDGTLNAWDLAAGKRIGSAQVRIIGDDEVFAVRAAVITSDGRRVAALVPEGLSLWLLDKEQSERRLAVPVTLPCRLTPDEGALAAFCDDGWVRLWDIEGGDEVWGEPVPVGANRGFAGRFACWLTPEGGLGRFDLVRRERRPTIGGFERGAAISWDGNFATTSPAAGGINLWHLAEDSLVASLPEAPDRNCAIWLGAHGGLVAVGGPTLTLWDIESARALTAVTGDGVFVTDHFEAETRTLTAQVHAAGSHRFRVEGINP